MADIKTSLVNEMKAHIGISALVGARIYPLILPQNPTLPAITYQRIDARVYNLLDGASSKDIEWFQIDCWGSSELSADAVAAQVDACFRRFSGLLGDDLHVAGIGIEGKTDFHEPENGIYRVMVEVRIEY